MFTFTFKHTFAFTNYNKSPMKCSLVGLKKPLVCFECFCGMNKKKRIAVFILPASWIQIHFYVLTDFHFHEPQYGLIQTFGELMVVHLNFHFKELLSDS